MTQHPEQPDPSSHGGHPYTKRELELGYGTERDPRVLPQRGANVKTVPDYSAKAVEALENAEHTFSRSTPQTGIFNAVVALGYCVLSVAQEISKLPYAPKP